MMGQISRSLAAPLRVLITNGGNHSPLAWAHETAMALVSIDKGTTSSRIVAAEDLRSRIYRGLVEHFQQVRPNMLASELALVGRSAVAAVFDAARNSPWEFEFSQPEIRAAMVTTIMRNIATAADLAVRTE